MYGQPVNKVVQWNTNISSVSGSAYPVWTTPNSTSYQVYKYFSSAADYTEIADTYQRCQIHKIRLIVSRLFSETQTIYSSGMPYLRIGFFPGQATGVATNQNVIDLESAFSVSPYAVNLQSHEFPIPNMNAFALIGTDTMIINMGQPFDTNSFSAIDDYRGRLS